MAFKFNWDLDSDLELVHDDPDVNDVTPPATASANGIAAGLETSITQLQHQGPSSSDSGARKACVELSLDDLIGNLPPALSFSPISVPLTSQRPAGGDKAADQAKILRRDLFDARFQLANEEDDSDDEGSAYGNSIPRVDSPPKGLGFGGNSDLVKGVYEGGLKTWEASLDLVDCFAAQGYTRKAGKSILGTRVLEVGCGTAMPSVYLLELLFRQLLEAEAAGQAPQTLERTAVHLQDYNAEVLLYITFCNILLAYWSAKKTTPSTPPRSTPSSTSFASTSSSPDSGSSSSGSSSTTLPSSHKIKRPVHTAISGDTTYSVPSNSEETEEVDELDLTDELIDSFLAFLERYNIELKFYASDWSTLAEQLRSQQGGLGYDLVLTSETVYDLDSLPTLVDLLQQAATDSHSAEHSRKTLVSCKKVYFGVGGGEWAFKQEVGKRGEVVNVWDTSSKGVERTVMQINWKP